MSPYDYGTLKSFFAGFRVRVLGFRSGVLRLRSWLLVGLQGLGCRTLSLRIVVGGLQGLRFFGFGLSACMVLGFAVVGLRSLSV